MRAKLGQIEIIVEVLNIEAITRTIEDVRKRSVRSANRLHSRAVPTFDTATDASRCGP